MPQILPAPGDVIEIRIIAIDSGDDPVIILGRIQSKGDGASVKVDLGSGFSGTVNMDNFKWDMEEECWKLN